MGLIPGADDFERSAEKAEDHLGTVATSQIIPAFIAAVEGLLAKKKVTITIQVEDKT